MTAATDMPAASAGQPGTSAPARLGRGAPAAAGRGAMTAVELVESLRAQLAMDSFSVIGNPKRRRLRRGDGSYHCDYRAVDELRLISRWQEYEAGTYGGLLSSWATYLGAPTWVPATADPAWNKAASAVLRLDLEAKKHDVRRRCHWGQYVRLLALGIARDGQIGIAHTANGAAAVIEAERLVDVEATSIGQVVNWMVADLKGGYLDMSTKRPIAASMIDVPQIVTRVSQWWGLPICFSTLDDHDGLADLWQGEIDSACEAARPWLKIQHKSGESLPGGQTLGEAISNSTVNSGDLAAAAADSMPAPGGRSSAPAGWVRSPNGQIIGIPQGLEGEAFKPERPNLDVPVFIRDSLRICSMVLLPYELAYLDQQGVNQSNGRGIRQIGNALLDYFRQTYLNAPLARQMRGLLRVAMIEKRLPFRDDFQLGNWSWPSIPEHDRRAERQADALDRANGTANLKDLVGEEWQDKMGQRAIELGLAAKLVEEHNAKYPNQRITIADIAGDPAHVANLALQMAQADAAAAASAPAASTPAAPGGSNAR